jgi:hypothetical protein
MKEITLKPIIPVTYSLSSDVSDNGYYGVAPEAGSRYKGFITRNGYGFGRYVTRCRASITKGNCWEQESDTLNDLIGKLLTWKFVVYEFSTAVELFEWLSKEPLQ